VPWGTAISPTYTLRDTDTILGVGDLNSTRQDDILIKTSTGLVVLEKLVSWSVTDQIPWSTSATGWPHATDRLDRFGDFDGDGITDFILRNGGRLALARVNRIGGISAITTHNVITPGTWMGGWNYAGTEQILGVGDFDGDGRQDFVIKSAGGHRHDQARRHRHPHAPEHRGVRQLLGHLGDQRQRHARRHR
jgi:hypothetical protein